jgi:glutaredoxin-related protein
VARLNRWLRPAANPAAPCRLVPKPTILTMRLVRAHIHSEVPMSDVIQRIDQLVKSNDVVLFMKGTPQFPQCGFSGRAAQILKACGVNQYASVNVLEDQEVRQSIKDYANWPTIPQLYVKGEFVGGSDIMMEMYESGELQQLLAQP